MADFTITEADRWEELEAPIADAMSKGGVSIGELWDAVAQGRHEDALTILQEIGYEIHENDSEVHILSFPDDIRGQFYRAWVKGSPRAGVRGWILES